MARNQNREQSDGGDAGQAEMQRIADEETAKGFRGTEVDTTPNHAYTVAGRVANEPIPTTEEAIRLATEAGKRTAPANDGGQEEAPAL